MEKKRIKRKVTIERVQSVFKEIDELVVNAVQKENIALLRDYIKKLNKVLSIAEKLRFQFVFGAAYALPYTIGDEISHCEISIDNIIKKTNNVVKL